MYFLTKKFSFDAAHKLEGYKGICSSLHGHHYACEVTIGGKNLKLHGKDHSVPMLMDFKELSNMAKNIVDDYDHTYLNDAMCCDAPTAEFMAMMFYQTFSRYINGLYTDIFLHSVKVWETPDSCAEYVGNDSEEFMLSYVKAMIK